MVHPPSHNPVDRGDTVPDVAGAEVVLLKTALSQHLREFVLPDYRSRHVVLSEKLRAASA